MIKRKQTKNYERVYFPMVLQEMKCPMPGCLLVRHSAGIFCKHFMYHHFRYKVVVVQEGTEPLPCCDLCRIYMPAGRITRQRKTACCNKKN